MSRYASFCLASTFQTRLNIAHRRRRVDRERHLILLRVSDWGKDEERPLVRETFDAIANSDAFTLEASIQAFLDVRPLLGVRQNR